MREVHVYLLVLRKKSHQFNASQTQLCQTRGGVWMFLFVSGEMLEDKSAQSGSLLLSL